MRPREGPPISEEYRARILAGRPRFEAIAREHYGLEVNAGPFGIDSRPSLIGEKFAEAHDKGDAYHDAVIEAYWVEARNIEERDVLLEIAESVGLDVDAFNAALDDPDWAARVFADVQQAYEYGLRGVPALIVNNKYLISGAQPYEYLVRVVEKVQEKE